MKRQMTCLLLLGVVLVSIETGWAQGDQRGDIAGIFTDRDGRPLEGLQVALSGLDRREITDSAGTFYFSSVPAGRVSLELTKSYTIIEPDGGSTYAEAVLENAADIFVRPFDISRVEGKVDAPEVVERLACGTAPNCAISCIVNPNGIAGAWAVKGKSWVEGPCPCITVTTPNIGAMACPGSALIAGALPLPGAVWGITTETCLGGPGCPLPVVLASCNIGC